MPVDSKGQVITFGALGTGKSHETKTEVAGKTWFRTTFHPDSDYASFLGAYKPMMKEDGVSLTEVSQKAAAGQARGRAKNRSHPFSHPLAFPPTNRMKLAL